MDGRHVVGTDEAVALGLFDARVDSTSRYAVEQGGLDAAVRAAAAPMLTAFPPHLPRS